MIGGSVSFTLDNGETLRVPDGDLRRVYEVLWELAEQLGAVSTAALVMDARGLKPIYRTPIGLTSPQSAVLRKAVAIVGEER